MRCLALLVLIPAVALAAEPGDYVGSFEIVSVADAEKARDEGIEAVAQGFSVIARGIVRKKLREAATVWTTLAFDWDGERMTIRSDANPVGTTTPLDRSVSSHTSARTGQSFQLSRWMEGGDLRALGVGDGGEQGFRWKLVDEGRGLELTVTTANSRLPQPLVYTLTYKRSK
jgi:hypothetical protein